MSGSVALPSNVASKGWQVIMVSRCGKFLSIDAVSLHGIDCQYLDLSELTTMGALICDPDEELPFDCTREVMETSSCGVSVLACATLPSIRAGNGGTIEWFSSLATEFTPFGAASRHHFRAIRHTQGWRAS